MRIIAHLDMDAFFAAIEERDNPRFRGRPIVVGADPRGGAGRGVVATANYAARAYGIRSALPISTAWKLAEEARRKGSPPVTFIGGSMRRYSEVSDRVMAIVRRHIPVVEEASVDEAYLELSCCGSYAEAAALCRSIKEDIRDAEKLTASIGIGPNKLIAKIASDHQKPDGLTVVTEGEAESFLEPLSIRVIPGVGPRTEEELASKKIRTIKDLKARSSQELREMMGNWGASLYDRARGKDDSPVIEGWEIKSVGEQETFEEDTRSPAFLTERLEALCEGVHERFRRKNFKNFRTVTVTVRFADFTTRTRSTTLKDPVNDLGTLELQAMRLFLPFLDARDNPSRKAIRLLGVRVEKLI